MDIFPGVSKWYEEKRNPFPACSRESELVDFMNMFREQLHAAYSKYFSEHGTRVHADEKSRDLEKLQAFEAFIKSLCALTCRQLPNIFTLLEAAEATMSGRFKDNLAASLLRHDADWALPKHFPGLPILSPEPRDDGRISGAEIQAVRLGMPSKGRGKNGEIDYIYSDSFYLDAFSGVDSSAVQTDPSGFPFEEATSTISKVWEQTFHAWVWPPCEFLLHGTAYEAANIAKSAAPARKTEAFEGALLEGIDVRATLRARSRGDQTLYVHSREKYMDEDLAVVRGESLEPTVFIFEDPSNEIKAGWHLGSAGGLTLRDHFETDEQRVRFDEAVQKLGSIFVGSVSFSKPIKVSKPLKPIIQSARELMGIVTFGNPCAHIKQSVMWLNAIGYNSCPIIQSMDFDTLSEFFHQHHNLTLNRLEWPSTLVRLAIPYARHRVVIVAHHQFVVDPICRKEAQARRIQLNLVPLSVWPRDRIDHLRRQYTVYAGSTGLHIEEQIELRLGSKEKYLDMLPPPMQAQVHSNR